MESSALNCTTSFSLEAGASIGETTAFLNQLATSAFPIAITSFFGIIFNIINIVVLLKQGSQDYVSIPLLGLAISDTGLLFFSFVSCLHYTPLLTPQARNVDVASLILVMSVWPHVMFIRITCCLTTYITFQRYLCIAIPLKVKLILNKKMTIVCVAGIFLVMGASILPWYTASSLGYIYNPMFNITVLTAIYAATWQDLQRILVSFNAFVELAAFVATAIFTCALVHKFLAITKWRRVKSNSSNISGRDKQVTRMVILISCVFVFCYIPSVAATVFSILVNDFSSIRLLFLTSITVAFAHFSESVNSAVTIFVYLKMSSRYRAIFLSLCRKLCLPPCICSKSNANEGEIIVQ